jgi:hypothetical protein
MQMAYIPESMISLKPSDLLDLLASRRPEMEVGSMPLEARKFLGCARDTIFLSSESAKHILEEHGDHIAPESFEILPIALRKGLRIGEASRGNFCTVSFVDVEMERRYFVAIKTTKDRRRTYVTSFHLGKARQTKSKLKRGQVLRQHW